MGYKQLIFTIMFAFLVKGCSNTEIDSKKVELRECTCIHLKNSARCFVNNIPFTGLCRSYFNTGDIQIEQRYNDGFKHGISRYWYKPGILTQELSYENGKLNGPAWEWWKNNSPRSYSQFRQDSLHGIIIEWYPNGQLKSLSEYDNGKRLQGFRNWNDDHATSNLQ